MKFSTPKNKIFSAVQNVLNVVPTRTTLPVLSNMLVEVTDSKLKLAATDLDISMITTIPISATKKGSITIPARTFAEILRELPESEIEIEVTENRMELKVEHGNYRLSGIPSDEFPKLPTANLAKQIKIPGGELAEMIQKTVVAVSTDETRPALNGVLWQTSGKSMQMVATDGHRLAKISQKNNKLKGLHDDIIIPPKALNLLVKLLADSAKGGEEKEIGVIFGENNIIFNLDDSIIASRIIEGPYPNFEQVIPKDNDKKLIVNKDLLTSTIRRVSILANTLTHQIKFSFKKDTLELSSANFDLGGEAKESLVCDYTAEPMDIGYNASYVMDVLKQIDGDEVIFELGTPVSAAMIYSSEKKEGQECLYLLMPLRLAE
ncbi:MAG: DNA polymerase III subunit beta [candidate division Zixibacteria bacterium]|nr:DNA polymerase III subunit beta [candidate division Zixibacteria bacterium]